jgi:hypothetical protein
LAGGNSGRATKRRRGGFAAGNRERGTGKTPKRRNAHTPKHPPVVTLSPAYLVTPVRLPPVLSRKWRIASEACGLRGGERGCAAGSGFCQRAWGTTKTQRHEEEWLVWHGRVGRECGMLPAGVPRRNAGGPIRTPTARWVAPPHRGDRPNPHRKVAGILSATGLSRLSRSAAFVNSQGCKPLVPKRTPRNYSLSRRERVGVRAAFPGRRTKRNPWKRVRVFSSALKGQRIPSAGGGLLSEAARRGADFASKRGNVGTWGGGDVGTGGWEWGVVAEGHVEYSSVVGRRLLLVLSSVSRLQR